MYDVGLTADRLTFVPRTTSVRDFLILDAVRASGAFAAVSDVTIAEAVGDAARKDCFCVRKAGPVFAACRKARAEGGGRSAHRVMLFNCATGPKYSLPIDNARHGTRSTGLRCNGRGVA